MSRVFESLFFHHHPWILTAAIIVAVAAAASMTLLMRHALSVTKRRPVWIALAGICGGTGVWTTHFVAIIGFMSHAEPVFDPATTLASLGVSVLAATVAITLAVLTVGHILASVAGALFAAGVAAMHFAGMSAVSWGMPVTYDHALLTAAIAFALPLSALAFPIAKSEGIGSLAAATAIIVTTIGGIHFGAMAAMELPVPSGVARSITALPHWLALEIAGFCLVVLFLAVLMLMVHRRDRARENEEAKRLRSIADLAIEGLAIVDERGTIVAVNTSLTRVLACEEAALTDRPLTMFLPEPELARLAERQEGRPIECEITDASGALIPVELAARTTDVQGQPHRVIAVRDLRTRRATERRIRFLAYNDQLTGLANRESFARKLEEALAQRGRSGSVAVLALDLDGFKAVNDTLGHHFGDQVLRLVGERIRCSTREEDLVARLSGDEFAILQYSGPRQPHAAEMLARRLVDLLSRPMIIEGTVVQTGTSIGIAVAESEAVDASGLQKSADLALYRAKEKGRGTFVFFEPHMDAVMRERRALENELRLALARNAFSLVYQPLYQAADRRLSGFEALLRWNHPVRGPISPAAFVPLAEQTGLINQIGQWVLRKACRDAMQWPDHLTVAVNLSPIQFADRKIVSTIRDALGRSGLAPKRLEVEITESVLLNNTTGVIKSLTEIRSLGVRIAMDDFGTGYSSLSYLRSFPFDRVKIDRSFVNDIENSGDSAAIVSAIIGLGHSLGMATTAEGIENNEQLERIRAEGCDLLQGFFLSRPVEFERTREIVEQDRTRAA